VVNGPAVPDAARPTGRQDGAGIIGMVTRARAIGGRLTAEQTDDGGFAVRARIPKQVGEAPAGPDAASPPASISPK
jgi:hypothetical protein